MGVQYAISDTHPDLATSETAEVQRRFIKYCRDNPSVTALRLVGDCCGSLLERTLNDVVNSPHFRDYASACRSLAAVKPLHIHPGNHDCETDPDFPALMAHFAERHTSVHLSWNVVTIGPRSFIFHHGHDPRFDPLTNVYDTLIGLGNSLLGEQRTSRIARWLIENFLRMVYSGKSTKDTIAELRAKASNSEADWDRYHAMISILHDRQQRWLFENYADHPATMIVGHSHFDIEWSKPVRDVRLVDCGAIDNPMHPTAVEINETTGFAHIVRVRSLLGMV